MNKREVKGCILGAISLVLLIVFVKFNGFFYAVPYGRILGWVVGIFGFGSCLASLGFLFSSGLTRNRAG